MTSFADALQRHQRLFERLKMLERDIEQVADIVVQCLHRGGKVLWMGNGGSAADAQHLAAELMVRYHKERGPLASLALTTDSSILTAHSNGYDFDSLFSRQIQGLGQPKDLLMGISTSGNSANVIAGIEQGRTQGLTTACLLGGDGGRLMGMADHSICVPDTETARIQEAHIFIGHWLCEALDERLSRVT